ncbi:MAG: hypothetical protein ACLPSM_14275 [Acidimicrobiales bacterium]
MGKLVQAARTRAVTAVATVTSLRLMTLITGPSRSGSCLERVQEPLRWQLRNVSFIRGILSASAT